MDGVTLGHPRCNVNHCTNRLGSPRHRFCLEHFVREEQCAVEGCPNPRRSRTLKTCALQEHSAMEDARKEAGNAYYLLKKRAAAFTPGSAIRSFASDARTLDEALEDPGLEDDLETLLQPKPSKATEAREKKKKAKAAFTRRWTFNEQLMVRPCGVILSRATFYEAESPSNVVVCSLRFRYLRHSLSQQCK